MAPVSSLRFVIATEVGFSDTALKFFASDQVSLKFPTYSGMDASALEFCGL